MPVQIRRFERRDRDQLTALINLHVAAVIPGVTLSTNTVLSQLEREPDESIVDPWVAQRCCLVAESETGILAAALLHRFRDDPDVGPSYRGTGELRWLVCSPVETAAGRSLLAAALVQMHRWGVRSVGAECALPAPGCYGIPDTLPHLRALLTDAGFGAATRTEVVLAARCADLRLTDRSTGTPARYSSVRTAGALGTRLTLSVDGAPAGYIEVCQPGAEPARNSLSVSWADIGNLVVADSADAAEIMPILLSDAADWLLLGGITGVVDYWAVDVDPPGYLELLRRPGFRHSLSTSAVSPDRNDVAVSMPRQRLLPCSVDGAQLTGIENYR